MALVQHKDLAEAELHEAKYIKAAVAADAGKVVTPSSSDNVGELRKLLGSEIDASEYKVTVVIADVSTAETIYVPVQVASKFIGMSSALGGTITTGNATIEAKNDGGTITGGTMTVAFSGSVAGTVDNVVFTSPEAITALKSVSVETDGGSTVAQPLTVVLHFTRD